MVNILYAKNGTFKMDLSSSVTISNSTVLDTAFASGTAITGVFKDISVEASNAEADIIQLCGVSSGGFQNAAMDVKPPGIVTISGKMVIPGDEVAEIEVFGAGTAAAGTHVTYRIGHATLIKVAFLINLDDTVDEVNYACGNAIVTKFGAPTLTGADGHWESDFELKCLPEDFIGPQFKN
jgi:hypothetical protein